MFHVQSHCHYNIHQQYHIFKLLVKYMVMVIHVTHEKGFVAQSIYLRFKVTWSIRISTNKYRIILNSYLWSDRFLFNLCAYCFSTFLDYFLITITFLISNANSHANLLLFYALLSFMFFLLFCIMFSFFSMFFFWVFLCYDGNVIWLDLSDVIRMSETWSNKRLLYYLWAWACVESKVLIVSCSAFQCNWFWTSSIGTHYNATSLVNIRVNHIKKLDLVEFTVIIDQVW